MPSRQNLIINPSLDSSIALTLNSKLTWTIRQPKNSLNPFPFTNSISYIFLRVRQAKVKARIIHPEYQ